MEGDDEEDCFDDFDVLRWALSKSHRPNRTQVAPARNDLAEIEAADMLGEQSEYCCSMGSSENLFVQNCELASIMKR